MPVAKPEARTEEKKKARLFVELAPTAASGLAKVLDWICFEAATGSHTGGAVCGGTPPCRHGSWAARADTRTRSKMLLSGLDMTWVRPRTRMAYWMKNGWIFPLLRVNLQEWVFIDFLAAKERLSSSVTPWFLAVLAFPGGISLVAVSRYLELLIKSQNRELISCCNEVNGEQWLPGWQQNMSVLDRTNVAMKSYWAYIIQS